MKKKKLIVGIGSGILAAVIAVGLIVYLNIPRPAEKLLTTFQTQVQAFYTSKKYTLPTDKIDSQSLQKAEATAEKLSGLKAKMNVDERQKFAESSAYLALAKVVFTTETTINQELIENEFVKDENYSAAELEKDFSLLQKKLPQFAKKISADEKLIVAEVAAIDRVQVATASTPDQEKITAATTAVKKISRPAFVTFYLKKIPVVAANGTITKSDGTKVAVKNPTPAQVATAKAEQVAVEKAKKEAVAKAQAEAQKVLAAADTDSETDGQTLSDSAATTNNSVAPVTGGSSGASATRTPTVATSKVLGVSFISQEAAGAPMGCEAASALEAMHFKGYATGHSLASFLKTMPIASNGNPYQGFGGTPYAVVNNVYQSIFPSAFVPWVSQFGGAQNISGTSVAGIVEQVRAGNPVVAWVTGNYQSPQWHQYNWGSGIDNAHVVCVDGFNSGSLHIVDPEFGTYWIGKSTFGAAYSYMQFAVAIV